MTTTSILNVSIELWGALFSIIAGITTILPNKKDKTSKCLANLEFCGAFLLIVDSLAYIYRGNVSKLGYYMVRISNELVYIVAFVLLFCFFRYLQNYLDPRAKSTVVVNYICDFVVISGVFIVLFNNFVCLLYTFDDSNKYVRGDYFFITFVLGVVGLVACFFSIVLQRRSMTRTKYYAFLSYAILPVVGVLLQIKFYGYSFLNISYTVGIFIIFFTTLVERAQYLVEKEQEISDMRMKMVMDYVQPEVMYQSIDCISEITDKHPNSARLAMQCFREYIEENFDAMYSNRKYDIGYAIKHMEKYLYLMQLKNDISIDIKYDIKYSLFQVNLNAVQRLVQQALEYGVTKVIDECSILFSIKEDENGHYMEAAFIPDDENEQRKAFTYRL